MLLFATHLLIIIAIIINGSFEENSYFQKISPVPVWIMMLASKNLLILLFVIFVCEAESRGRGRKTSALFPESEPIDKFTPNKEKSITFSLMINGITITEMAIVAKTVASI